MYFRLAVLIHEWLPKVWMPGLLRPIVFLLVYIGARDFPNTVGSMPLKPLVLATIADLCFRLVLDFVLAKKYPLDIDADMKKTGFLQKAFFVSPVFLVIIYFNSEESAKHLVTFAGVINSLFFLTGLTDKELLQKYRLWAWGGKPSPVIEYAAKVRAFAYLSFAVANELAIRILDTNTWIVWMILMPYVIMYFANTFTVVYEIRVSRGHEDSD